MSYYSEWITSSLSSSSKYDSIHSVPAPTPTPTRTQAKNPVYFCGKVYNNISCIDNNCCSHDGFCGTTNKHCTSSQILFNGPNAQPLEPTPATASVPATASAPASVLASVPAPSSASATGSVSATASASASASIPCKGNLESCSVKCGTGYSIYNNPDNLSNCPYKHGEYVKCEDYSECKTYTGTILNAINEKKCEICYFNPTTKNNNKGHYIHCICNGKYIRQECQKNIFDYVDNQQIVCGNPKN